MQDQQLLRYSRHILLPEIDVEGQQALLDAHVLLIGAGGLGAPAALYLAAAGVGTITVCDDDVVDLTNLQRQIIHSTETVGLAKVESAKRQMRALNPEVAVVARRERLAGAALLEAVRAADLVIDASDNFATRHAVNRACVAARTPLVSGAAIRFDGQVAVFDFRQPDSPCYHCLYPEDAQGEEIRCSEMGVFSPLVGLVGSMQAAEAIKALVGCGRTLNGRLLLIDALDMEWRTLRLKRDPGCPACGAPGAA